MNEEQRIDYGSIHIHKKALADIVAAVIEETEGVFLAPDNAFERFLRIFVPEKHFAIAVSIDRDNDVTIEARICVRLGLNIPEVSRSVQEIIRETVEKMTDIQVKDVHVNVQGIKGGVA